MSRDFERGSAAWALSAIDISLWDTVAKTSGLPLITLLGGFARTVPVYGSGGWHTLSDEELVIDAMSFVEQGITAYKYKTGTTRDQQRTELLRTELGDGITLFADANQRFNVSEAIEHSKMLANYNVAWLEEPVLADSIDDLAAVAARSTVPIAAGENADFRWEFREIAERRAAAYLQPDVARVGGVTEFRRVAALADAFNLRLSSHLWRELSISLVGASPMGYLCQYAPVIPADALTREFLVVDGAIEPHDTRHRFEGRVVFVVGGESGIGQAVATRCGEEGASVAVAGIDQQLVAETTRELERRKITAIGVTLDVRDESSVERGFDEVIEQLGRLDAVHANAGIGHRKSSLIDLTKQEWDDVATPGTHRR